MKGGLLGKTKLLGFLLTFIFLGLVLWQTNLSELGGALSSANYLYVIPAAFCTLISYILRTIRWRRILLPTRSIPARRLFPVLMIGFMANNVLPARLGEFVRAYSLGQKESISKSLSFATIMLERLLDGVTLVVILALISLSVPLQDWGAEIAYIACAVFLAAAIGVVALLVREDLARRLIFLVLRPWPRATGRIPRWCWLPAPAFPTPRPDWAASSARNFSGSIENLVKARCSTPSASPTSAA